jgi:hypothetical protein
MLLEKKTIRELKELSEEARERLKKIEEGIEEESEKEQAGLEKALKAIDNKHKRKVETIACLAVGFSGIALTLGIWAANNRIQQANVGDATPSAPHIVDDGRPPETTEIDGTVIPKGRFKPNAIAGVAQSVVMVYNAKGGRCSASVVGNQNLISAAHCEIAPNDTVYVPSAAQSVPVVGVAAAAVGDAVILQTDQNLGVPPLKIAAPEYRVTIGPFKFKTPWNLPFSEKLKTTEDVAIIGFPGFKIFQRARQGQEALNTETKRYAFPAYADNTRLSHDSTAATGSVPEELISYSAPDPETFIRGMSGGPAVNRQGDVVGLPGQASQTQKIQNSTRPAYIGINPIDTSKQFCIRKEGQEKTIVTLEHLLAMQFTGNNRCS